MTEDRPTRLPRDQIPTTDMMTDLTIAEYNLLHRTRYVPTSKTNGNVNLYFTPRGQRNKRMPHKPQCQQKLAEYQAANQEYMQALAGEQSLEVAYYAAKAVTADKLAARDQKYQAWITCENSG